MAAVFKEKYRIDPLSVSQTHLLRYEAAPGESVALVPGRAFADLRLSVVDFHLLNNLTTDLGHNAGSNLHYTNKWAYPVQVAVFLTSELGKDEDFEDKIPFRSVYLAAHEKGDIPLPPGAYSLYIFDGEGRTVDSRKITAAGIGRQDN
jgi:hypothetical protein